MDTNDSLIVVDATNNDAAWYRLSDEVANQKTFHQDLNAHAGPIRTPNMVLK